MTEPHELTTQERRIMPGSTQRAQVSICKEFVELPMASRFALSRCVLIATAVFVATVAVASPVIDSEPLSQRLEQPRGSTAPALTTALLAFYRTRDFAPAWANPSHRQALLNALAETRNDGLNPQDYGLDTLREAWSSPRDPATDPIDTDILATRSLFTALAHLLNGKVDPRTLQPDWNFQLRPLDLDRGLRSVALAIDSGRIEPLFAGARPQHALYEQLRAGLRQLYRTAEHGGWPPITSGETLKPGMQEPRIAVLRERLRLSGYLAVQGPVRLREIPGLRQRQWLGGHLTPTVFTGDADEARHDAWFDPSLESAVRRFQHQQYLAVDGTVGKATLAALNVPVSERIAQLRANLERARWLLHEPSPEFLLVDIAGYKASLFQNGQPIWSTRVQVGKPYRETPSFRSQIDQITFNPTWTVPPTILRKDILPKVRANPGYLAANRLRALDASGSELDPSQIDWNNPRGVTLRQDAGSGAALGQVAIRFDNPYSVYLHDTPHTELFDHEQRAFSSGCIRVEQPLELVERLFNDPVQWNRAAIDAAIASRRTHTVRLPQPVTVLLVYWSVDAHRDGRLSFKPDIYRRDARLLMLLDQPQPLRLGN